MNQKGQLPSIAGLTLTIHFISLISSKTEFSFKEEWFLLINYYYYLKF